ncbi:uncharacterized protein JCM15063_003896 [Sporobolomyces koalae]|uniref:uncharacterized protein n=1 Tax=Sporobolomyces koalae TaxID=500713 RepID=UPI0031754296
MSHPESAATSLALEDTVELPCGKRLPNRLVKSAMAEIMSINTLPNERLNRLYKTWSGGRFGMIISGNVQVAPNHLGLPFDVAIPLPSKRPNPTARERYASWAASMNTKDPSQQPLRIMQLNHPGRQSMRVFTGRSPFTPALAPSAVPMTAGKGRIGEFMGNAVWGIPRAMTNQDIEEVVQQFLRGAKLAQESGWDGVQLHASHGYLLAQFLSPHTNLRTDEYGGTPRKRIALLLEIASRIRAEYPLSSGFVLGVKLNASDYIRGGLTEEDALDNVRWLTEHGGFDFIEISGGSYEAPEFLSTKSSTSTREAFFAEFSRRAYEMLSDRSATSELSAPRPLVLLTGGLRTRVGMRQALADPVADLVGVGRPAAVDPHLAAKILDPKLQDDHATIPSYDPSQGTLVLRWLFAGLTLFGPSLDVLYHNLLMHDLARVRLDSTSACFDGPTVRERLVSFPRLVKQICIDPFVSPRTQRLVVWFVVGFALVRAF